MRKLITRVLMSAILFAAAGVAHAQWTYGPLNGTFSSGSSLLITGFETTFAAGGSSEAWTIDVTSATNAGCVVFFMDVTRSAGGGPVAFDINQWNAANVLAGVAGAGSGQGTYNTPAYNGTLQRFSLLIIPYDANGTFSNDVSVTITNAAGASAAPTGVPGVFSDVYAASIGTSGTSAGYCMQLMNSYDSNLSSTLIAAATDEIQFDFSVNYTGGTGDRPFSLWSNVYAAGGSGNLIVELWDLTADGFSATPTLQLDLNSTAGTGLSGGEEGAVASVAPAGRTGTHNFRVIVRPGAGFTAPLRAWWQVTFDRTETTNSVSANTPKQATPRMAITPASSTLTTSPAALTASGGTPTATYNWSFTGTVPTGVGFNTAGTTTATGASVNLVFGSTTPAGSTVTVRVTNGTGPEFVEETYTLNYSGGGGGNSLTIVTTTLPNGSETVVYTTTNITATSTGTTGPTYTWSVSAGTIPPGLVLDTAATGLTTTISGTPTTAGTYNFTVQITDGTNSDTQDFQVDISAAGSLVITTASLPAGTQGTAYSANITAINGTGNHSWTISAGTLPTGLSLGASTTDTVSISGTPTQSGTFPITVQVTDSSTPTAQTDTQAFSLVISAGSPPPGLTGGGGGGGGGGCAATDGSSYWMFALGLLAMLGLGLRMRARRE